MRLSVMAAAICLSLVGLSMAAQSRASIRRTTDILPQPLGVALRSLARDRGLQLVYESAAVNPLRTRGARGDLTSRGSAHSTPVGYGVYLRIPG